MDNNRNNVKIILLAIEAKDLLAGDFNGLSDPYFKIPRGQVGVVDLPKKQNKTRCIDNTLNPIWNESFLIEYDPTKCTKLRIEVYDYDYIGKDDFLGGGYVTLEWINTSSENFNEEWIPLKIEQYNKKTKQNEVTQKGSVHIKIRALGFNYLDDNEDKPFVINDSMPQEILKAINFHKYGDPLQPGSWIIVSQPEVYIGLGWDFSWGEEFDLDASVTGFNIKNQVIESIYYLNLEGLSRSVKHFEDNLTGEGSGDDEVIRIFLDKVPEDVHYLTVTINSYKKNSLIKAKSAFIRLYTKKEKIGKYLLKRTKDCIGLLLGVFERDTKLNIWYFRVMADPIEGNVVTESIKSIQKLLCDYSINKEYIDEKKVKHPFPDEELFKVEDWIPIDANFVYVGLGWNLQKGFNFDLDASILTFDANNNLQEIIYHQNLKSKNNSIIHQGDNKTGEGEGDDEILSIDFGKLDKTTTTIAVLINSFKGNSIINVKDAFIRLYDKDKPIGINILEECPDCIGLFIGLFRKNEKTWYFAAVKEPVKGIVAKESVGDVKNLLDKFPLKI